MAISARDIKRRIKSVKNTQQITKAMKMVYAAKLRKAQERVVQARPYAQKMAEVVASVAKAGGGQHPMLTKRERKRVGYVVITSDRGLAGAYNGQVIRHAVGEFSQLNKDEYLIYVVGRKGRDYFNRRNFPVKEEITGLSDFPTFAEIKRVTEAAVSAYQDEIVDEVYLVYNKFISALSQVPVTRRLLPLEDIGGDENTGSANYLYEPSAEEVLDELLPKYAETQIYAALLEAKASECGARMTAMGNATDNAGELIRKYTLELNRARQAAITTQISEIVGGAAAVQ